MTAADTPNTDAMNPGELFGFLMATKYVPAYQETARRESERRTDAFADNVTYTVCGEEIRLMTPRDLLMLDGFENAFVCAGEPKDGDVRRFLWQLHVDNDGTGSWRMRVSKGRFEARMDARTSVEDDASEVYDYMDRLWPDTPADPFTTPPDGAQDTRGRKPAGVYCLAPLMVNVAGAIGPIDPMGGKLLGDTPIPRLLQYQREAIERKTGEDAGTSFDSLKSRCLEEVNIIMANRRAKDAAAGR